MSPSPARFFRVGLNAQLLSGQLSYRSAGIHRYIHGLLDHLPAADPRFAYTVFTGPDVRLRTNGAVAVQHTGLPTASPLARIVWEQCVQPWAAWQAGLDLLHSTAFALPLLATTATVVTVHDISFVRRPARFRLPNRAYLNLLTGLSCRRAGRVIAVSRHTQQEVVAAYGLPPEKVEVVYSGLDSHFVRPAAEAIADFRTAHGLPERFILYLGTIEPRKNLSTLIRAYGKVRPPGVKLVCAGGRGWMHEDVFQTVEELRLSREVIFPGFVRDEDLPYWYAAAQVFVYPSSYEGFGFPVVEALACGVPTITSNSSSMPEAAGDAALLVPPDDIDALAEALARLMGDGSLQADLAARGPAQAARFSWPETARRTACVYLKALGLTGSA